MEGYKAKYEKEKQKSDASKASIFVFIISSLYLHYTEDWIHLIKLKTLFYFLSGVFASGILLGILHYYLSKLITYALLSTIRNPTESNIKTYSTIAFLLGIPFFTIGLIIDYQLSKLYFNWWY